MIAPRRWRPCLRCRDDLPLLVARLDERLKLLRRVHHRHRDRPWRRVVERVVADARRDGEAQLLLVGAVLGSGGALVLETPRRHLRWLPSRGSDKPEHSGDEHAAGHPVALEDDAHRTFVTRNQAHCAAAIQRLSSSTMRGVAIVVFLGTLFGVGLASCGDPQYFDFTTRCTDEMDRVVPCCGPPGKKYACPPDAGDDGGDDDGGDAGDDDGGPDAGPDGSSFACPGQCVPQGGGGFSEQPLFVAMRAEGQPPLPPLAPNPAWQGWVDVQFAEAQCPTCTCAAPVGSCVLPASWNANPVACQDLPAPSFISFNAPAAWNGMCSKENAIPAGLMCDNGPCVQSLTVTPPLLIEEPCAAAPEMAPGGEPLPPPTRTEVLAYSVTPFGPCEGGIDQCIVTPPPGYKVCVARYLNDGYPCPPDWPDRHEGWEIAEDGRSCGSCTCGAPAGGQCTARVKAYLEDACGQELTSMILPSDEPSKCNDLFGGAPLGSKTAEVLSYEPGTCQPSGGELKGQIATDAPAVFCCRAPLPPVP
jgi:hypothetical protein